MVKEYDNLINDLCLEREALTKDKKDNHFRIKHIEVLARNLVLEKIEKYQRETNDILVGVIINDKYK